MLNEIVTGYFLTECPLCGRAPYHCYPDYWCPVCGVPGSYEYSLLEERISALEEAVFNNDEEEEEEIIEDEG